MKWLGILMLLVGCQSYVPPSTLEEAKAYAAEFDEEFGIESSKIHIWVGVEAFTADAIALCIPARDSLGINKEHWDRLGPRQKRTVIYHEKLHCDYHIEHIADMRPDNLPTSLMFPSMQYFSEGVLKDNWEYYLSQAHTLVTTRAYRF